MAEASRDDVNGHGMRMAESFPRRRVRASRGLVVANLHARGPKTADPPASSSAAVDLDSQGPMVANLMLLRPVTADSSCGGHIAVITIVVTVVITIVVVVVVTVIVAGPIDVPLTPKAHQLRAWSTTAVGRSGALAVIGRYGGGRPGEGGLGGGDGDGGESARSGGKEVE
uniref:Uncharacterized protein n=1 Tax=Oryza rufipogon TaxID=4529 RepID=A0A0E0Q9J2_ORYRU